MTTNAVPMSQWPSEYQYTIPVAAGPDTVTLTIDGRTVEAPRGELLIRVAQDHGTYIPRFCWHERLKPVGMCRMCLVEIDGMRGLQISCATPVADGMVVRTTSPAVKTAQDGVLEFLLINHPLDCPVCDRGGECPLQDQTLAFGPGESPLRRGEAPLREAHPHQRPRDARPGALHPVRTVHPVRGGGRRGPAHRLRWPRRGHRGDRLHRHGLRFRVLGQHGPDLPGRRAHRPPLPVPGPPLGPRGDRDVLHGLHGRLPRVVGIDVEPSRAAPRRRFGAREPRLALRQGPIRPRLGAERRRASGFRSCGGPAS